MAIQVDFRQWKVGEWNGGGCRGALTAPYSPATQNVVPGHMHPHPTPPPGLVRNVEAQAPPSAFGPESADLQVLLARDHTLRSTVLEPFSE